MKITCSICGSEVKTPGALWFDPPDEYGRCDKYHLCHTCNDDIHDLISYYLD